MINPYLTVISQYINNPPLLALVDTFNEAADGRALTEIFYNDLWNIDTATGYGLDVWGRIIGIDRSMRVLTGSLYWGFESALPGVTTFGFGPFYNGQALREPFTITDDDDYRRLILAKAATNLSDGSITSVNKILMDFFQNRGNAYVREETVTRYRYFGFDEAGGADGFDGFGPFGDFLGFRSSQMIVTYVVDFDIRPWEKYAVIYSPAIPHPAGVTIRYEIESVS
jgi:hypothetical protein